MAHDTVVILGIPLDNLTMEETLVQIFSMIDAFQSDGRPRLIATVNVDFIVNTLSWRLKKIRHPELLDILRRADLVIADGMPVVWISKLLGKPLKERVAGSDLVPRLAAATEFHKLSFYFLGGREGIGKRAAEVLQEQYPNMVLAGADAPFVHVAGEALGEEPSKDELIVKHINEAKPDILLIAFGNPKQEIWFNRNRHRLKVPVSIGIGGTFEFITGSVKRAPKWMQQTGLEWVYRITQDPWRLWKRYFIGFLKFGLMVWPAILYYRYKYWRSGRYFPSQIKSLSDDQNISSPHIGILRIIALPEQWDAAAVNQYKEKIEQCMNSSINLVFDLTLVNFIDSSGLGSFILTWRRGLENNNKIFLININNKVRRFFTLNRTWDLFKENVLENVDAVMERVRQTQNLPPFYYYIQNRSNCLCINFVGRLDALQMMNLDLASLMHSLESNNCIFNLQELSFLDSSGLSLFLKIQRHLNKLGKKSLMCGLNDNVRQLFRITQLDRIFRFAADIPEAEEALAD